MDGDLVDLARLGGGRVALSASAVREFAAGLDGLLVRSGDLAWDQAVSVWSGRVVVPRRWCFARRRRLTSPRPSISPVVIVSCSASKAADTALPGRGLRTRH